ncbi:MAG: hypothetical protein IT204_04810 [Fimbriimonadaceae bacterium]|nr:hypothetical protein [Fimbriimonadaceae bacterium]
MLVCSQCGTLIQVAGHACPACGHKGSIDRRFWHGEVLEPPGTTDLATAHVSAAGTLPEEQRAWTPWLAAALLLLPCGAVYVAATNLRRIGAAPKDAVSYLPTAFLAQTLVTAAAGALGRSQPLAALGLLAAFNVLVAALLVRWQAAPVAARRAELPGRHSPGTDALGTLLVAVLVGLLVSGVTFRLGDRLADGEISSLVRQALPAPPAPAAPHEMVMPPMG